MTRENSTITLAKALHEAGRPAVLAGETLAHAVDPAKVRPFVEWVDLPPHVVVGRAMTAASLLGRFTVSPHVPDVAYDDICDAMVADLAAALHEAERTAIESGNVLVSLGRQWIPFDGLPEQAKAGRKRQAFHLLQRYRFGPK